MGVVLITGCGSGFGLLAAAEAARRGHVVYAGLRRLESRQRLDEATAGAAVHALQLDVTSEAQRDAAVDRILAEQGRIDALVNNAGIAVGGFLEEFDEDELRTLFEVNVFGAWALTRRILPTMREQASGTLVMISSMSGRMALPGLGAYAGSKFALEGMSEAWRHELAPFGIRVVILEPGPYKTDIFGRNRNLSRRTKDPSSPYASWTRHLDAVMEARVDRAGDPQEVAHRICDVIEQRSPRLRHPMGRGSGARAAFARLAPSWLIERAVARLTRP